MSERIPVAESQLQATLVEAARVHGWLVYHTFDSRRSAGGFPDLVLARRGLVFAWELKGDDVRGRRGRLSVDQAQWLAELGGGSGHGVVVPGLVEPEDLERALDALRHGRAPA